VTLTLLERDRKPYVSDGQDNCDKRIEEPLMLQLATEVDVPVSDARWAQTQCKRLSPRSSRAVSSHRGLYFLRQRHVLVREAPGLGIQY